MMARSVSIARLLDKGHSSLKYSTKLVTPTTNSIRSTAVLEEAEDQLNKFEERRAESYPVAVYRDFAQRFLELMTGKTFGQSHNAP